VTTRWTWSPKFTTHQPRDPCGQVHFRDGCLCIYCKHFYECRVLQVPLAKMHDASYADRDRTIDITAIKEFIEKSECARKVLKSLAKAPKTVRELAIDIGYSMRHVHRVVKRLEQLGALTREAELIKDVTRTTDGRLITTYEKIWRYHVNGPVTQLLNEVI